MQTLLTQFVYAIARACIDAWLDAVAESKTAEFARSSAARTNAYRERLRRWQNGTDSAGRSDAAGGTGQGKVLVSGLEGDAATDRKQT